MFACAKSRNVVADIRPDTDCESPTPRGYLGLLIGFVIMLIPFVIALLPNFHSVRALLSHNCSLTACLQVSPPRGRYYIVLFKRYNKDYYFTRRWCDCRLAFLAFTNCLCRDVVLITFLMLMSVGTCGLFARDPTYQAFIMLGLFVLYVRVLLAHPA